MASTFNRGSLKRTALAMAMGLCFAGGVHAQSSVGSIFGQTAPNNTITITSAGTGASRTITADADGRYNFSQLPPGRYTVVSNGVTRTVNVAVGQGSAVNFTDAANLDTVTVTGTAYNANAIDVSSVASNTVFTAEQMQQIPVQRSVASVALLAPSVISNSSYSSNAPSFGGSASSENAYYINGYAVTNPLTAIGFTSLPFDAIDQTEVLTGGYGPQYGRSTGGVVAVTTKRGTNDWKFGGAVYFTPRSLRSDYRNEFYPNTGFYGPGQDPVPTDGQLYNLRELNKSQTLQYGVYAGGPIVKDRLFFYASADLTKTDQSGVSAVIPQSLYDTRVNPATIAPTTNGWYDNTYDYPRWMAKLDWQINDNHSVEFTGVQDATKRDLAYSSFDYQTRNHTTTQTGGGEYEDVARLYVGRYIGHFTDNLSLSVLYGKQDIDHSVNLFGYDPSCPRISGFPSNVKPGVQRPARVCQTQANAPADGTYEGTRGGRIDLDWTLGSHNLRFGADITEANTFSSTSYAGGYVWVYQTTNNYNTPVDAAHGVGAPGPAAGVAGQGNRGWFVRRQYYTNSADVKTEQRAYYIQDNWQVTDNFLLSIGLRNENFTNYNGDGEVYVEQKNQWAPRLGFSWDVAGDASFKVFGNAGRYHLALPNNVAARAAAASLYTLEYFNYTGMDQVTGAPTGLTNIPVTDVGYSCPGNPYAISSNLECGNARDPRVVAAKDLKPHYQDEFILGFQHQFSENVNWGVRGQWRSLKSAIDDTCTPVLSGECFIFNPGIDNTFYQADASGNLVPVTYTAEELGFDKVKRKYWSLQAYIEHSFANNWFGRVEYTFSKNKGNTEGQLHSDLDTGAGGQGDVSVTQDWDLPTLMEGAYGLLPNHRAHQIKGYGYYRLTPEFRVGATAIVTSGRPLSCTSFYPDPKAPAYNGAYYHWCGMPPSASYPGGLNYTFEPRGTSGSTPWTHQLNLNAEYRPLWADKKLSFQVDVFNVLNEQDPQFAYMRYAADRATPSRFFGQDLNYGSPRSVTFTVRYDY